MDEVQSAYRTSEQVTLHTTVAYFPKSAAKSHRSVVGIFDVNMHNAEMVVAMITKLVPILKDEYPNLRFIHYLTDSPTSQYRNKSFFKFITGHSEKFGLNARWDYLEAGHGKGLGGSVKRSADMAINQGKAIIQNANDFFAWTQKQNETDTSVRYYTVDKDEYDLATEEIKQVKTGVKAVPGTFQIHAVAPIDKHTIASREVSCNCESCSAAPDKSSCSGWKVHKFNINMSPEKN